MRKALVLLVLLIVVCGAFFLFNPFASPGKDSKPEIVTIDSDDDEVAALQLQRAGIIKSFQAFTIALSLKNQKGKIKSGGYYLSNDMDAFKVIDELSKGPDLKWVLIPEGLRKEQIGERLQEALGWSNEELDKWNDTYTAMKFDYIEGVYFPDTYLIPIDEDGLGVAARMTNHFNEQFAPYLDEFAKKDIKWTTGLSLASIVQREAAGPRDMPLIAGILWNRLLKGQKLEVDATVQYARGKKDGEWWAPVSGADIQNTDSSYNTYQHLGLPPHPISNPGIRAIEAVLNPQETNCLYYIHAKRQIYCADTYEEHKKNIEKYLN